MSRPPVRLILVTGSPRSGTTAVGQVLSLGRGVGTLHEPFNYLVGWSEIERYFEIPGTDSFTLDKLDRCISQMQRLDLTYKHGVFPRDHGLRRALKYVVGGRAVNSYRLCRLNPFLHTVIWKDPFACFAADTLAKTYGLSIVVTLRSPWAVAASFKRMGWSFDLDDVAERLTALGIDASVRQMQAWRYRESSSVNGAILWHLIYAALGRWSSGVGHIRFVDIDAILEAPTATYRALYCSLGLHWRSGIADAIGRRYQAKEDGFRPDDRRPHDRRHNPTSINIYWQRVLDRDEARIVSDLNAELWDRMRYAGSSGRWEPVAVSESP